jgi:HD-GYP domain-containing protein (c-di-GMP phosphodiesterase class II)
VIGVEGRGTAAGRGWEDSMKAERGAVRRCLRERRAVLSNENGASELAVPVHVGREVWGAFDLRASASDAFDADDARLVELVADHTGAALRTAELYRKLEQTHLGVAEALAAALEAKDGYTAGHARWIAELGVEVGRELGLSEDQLGDLRYGAIFHDIGKIAIPDAILNKQGPLTAAEFEVIKTHPEVGEQILAPVPFLADVRKIVRHDHERWDGTGYPDGLRGPQIPVGARIVLVVDAFHAMISDRPYREAMPEEDALKELRANAGSQFDPTVVEALVAVLQRHQTSDIRRQSDTPDV